MPVAQEWHADNFANLLAGYWVAVNRRAIGAKEAERLVEENRAVIEAQKDDYGQDNPMNR